ncbi:MAG: hypothetical protein EHM17_04400 [Verrucomicrobiaceae bacterium]|nr:MAG: hypothetical protein EHM17_04400 [Verrucomicrobiaceae bacterium]
MINSPGFPLDTLAASHFVSSADIKTVPLHNAAITANATQSVNFMGLSRSKRILENSFIGGWIYGMRNSNSDFQATKMT